MMTRKRKSKAAAPVAPVEPVEPEVAPSETITDAAKSNLSLSIPEDVDFDLLSNLLPDVSLASPSSDEIISLYRLVVVQATDIDATQRDLEEARSELQKKDVELDQVLQDKESSSKEVESELETLQKELKYLKQERDQLLTSHTSLQAQITTLSSSQSSSSTEVESLKRKVEDTEREKRDLVGIVSRLKEDSNQRDEEIQTLRTNLKQARHDYQALESELREVRSTETSSKFKVDALTQQLQLAKDEAERATTELTTKSEDFAKHRQTKHSELAQLQSAHDALAQTHASTEGTLKALQSAHASQSKQLAQQLARVQELTGRLAEQEGAFASEAAGLRRLVQVMEEREAQAKAIVEGIEAEWADVGARAERREAVLREEIAQERRRAEDAEVRIEEMERVLEKVNRGEFPVPAAGGMTPATPARGGAGATADLLTQGMMGLSPTVAMASRSQRSGKTFTEVYAEYVRLQEEHAHKTAEYDHMERTLSAVLAQIEERAPILAQQREEYERVQSEAAQLASQLAAALRDREAASTNAQETAQKLAQSGRENDLLQKQLNDLARQVQALLKEVGRAHDASLPSDDELEQDDAARPAENIEDVITNHLVLFRSIPALQAQNQKLLRIVRELGAKMEAEEREYKDTLEREQNEAVREAHDAIRELQGRLESQRKSHEVTVQAYVKEGDALKSMLARTGGGASAEPYVNGTGTGSRSGSGNGGVNGAAERVASESREGVPESELAKELAEIQSQFDTYKMEMGVDSVRVRDELVKLQRENGQLGALLAKANAKNEYTAERHKMALEQYANQAEDLRDMSVRLQELRDKYARADIECNRAIADVISANGKIEQLVNERANLRAEKRIWEGVQNRLLEENKALSIERSHLSDLMGNVQKMHTDLERSGENDRRRLESQIQMLENQTQDLRSQLSQERDSVRHLTLKKEIEVKELQARVDKQAQELSHTRESLIGAQMSKTHLEERVAELSRQLQGNEEKLAVYERRGSTSALANGDAQPGVSGADHLSKEQQLEAEVAELRAALKVAELDLANARSHVQQFQEISQANEAALASLNATYDDYKSSTESQLSKHESNYNALSENLRAVQHELTASREAMAETKRTFDDERESWANDKRTLEDTLVELTTSEKHIAEDRTSHDAEIRQQEERAKSAEAKYKNEVIAHGESLRDLEGLKEQLSKLQVEARTHLAAAETAQAKLVSSESSWGQQRDALDKEIADLTARSKELTEQNKVLHQHLDSVSSQAARIRQAADASSAPSGESEPAGDVDEKLSDLRRVIAYLRREKEIVDMQLELSKQENARLKLQATRLSQDLEDTRATLSEERERAVAAVATDAQHAELVEKINQLTILRESNATLRADAESQGKRARALDAKLTTLSAEIEPVREQVRMAQAELEGRQGHIARLEEENKMWQQRSSQLLSKYDRIDPAEVQALKDEIERLKSEKAEFDVALSTRDQQLQERQTYVEGLEKSIRDHRDLKARTENMFRQKLGQLNGDKTRLTAENTQLTKDLQALQTQLKTLGAERDAVKATPVTDSSQHVAQELEKVRKEKLALEQALQQEKAQKAESSSSAASQATLVASLTQERDRLLAEKATWATATPAASVGTSSEEWAAEKAELVKTCDEASTQAKAVQTELEKLKEEARNLSLANKKFQQRLQENQAARQRATAEHEAAIKAAVDKATSELQAAASSSSSSDELVKKHTEELQALEQRLRAKHQEELKAAVDAAVAKAKAQSSTTPATGEKAGAVNAKHEEEIAKAMESGRLEGLLKMKMKDSQLVRAQSRVKALEAQIEQWKKSGLIPETTTTSPTAPAAQASASAPPSAPAPVAPAPAANTAASAGRGAPRASAAAALPRKPSLASAGPLASGAPGRGRGQGAGRGLNIRGSAAASSEAGPSNQGGVSIMGAAGKRAREESGAPASDSLAKRLKPTDGSAPGTGGKPVTLQRNRVGPS